MIFGTDYFVHFFRRLLTAARKPLFHNRIKAASEKFNVVFNMPIIKIPLCLVNVIILELELIIIPKLKVGAVKQLIFLDMAKQF